MAVTESSYTFLCCRSRPAKSVSFMTENMTKPQSADEVREAIIESVIGSMALSGLTISREDAERAFEQVWSEPFVDIMDGSE